MNEHELSAQTALVITNSFGSNGTKSTFNSDYCYGCSILLRETDKKENFIDQTKRHTELSKE